MNCLFKVSKDIKKAIEAAGNAMQDLVIVTIIEVGLLHLKQVQRQLQLQIQKEILQLQLQLHMMQNIQKGSLNFVIQIHVC